MEATAPSPAAARLRSLAAGVDSQAIATWLLGFGLVVYLALKGGGYDPVVRDQLGIAVWWGLVLGLAVGALPVNRLRGGSWAAFGLLAAYVAWVALSITWSRTAAGSFEDLGRVVTYLGVFALALSVRGPRGARRMVSAVGAGVAVVAAVALLSRLHPAWFPGADETVEFLKSSRNRLAYPLGYWNGVAALVAIGLPLVLHMATSARRIALQALAAAALPAMALTVYFTFSRGGTLAAVVALAVYMALAHDRVPRAATLAAAAIGAAILIAAAHQRGALDAGLGTARAHSQGDQMLAMTLVVCAGVGLLQAAIAIGMRYGTRPAWTQPSRRASLAALAVAVAVVVAGGLALGAPGKASHAWHEFKAANGTPHGAARFESFSSNGRWPLWESALDQSRASTLHGTGSGSFEGWWMQHRKGPEFVRDAHSLYFESLGELGVIGLLLIAGFLGWVLFAGARRYALASRQRRTQLAAALAGCAAFVLGAAYDWLWELAVIPIAMLLLASVLVSAGDRPRRRAWPLPARLGGALVAAAAMVAIAIPLSSAASLHESQAQARAGDIAAALGNAVDARQAEPFAAAPRVQEALLLEQQGRLAGAEDAALAAVDREARQWRAWVILSRIQAERGRAHAALGSYRRARDLNPTSPLFSQ